MTARVIGLDLSLTATGFADGTTTITITSGSSGMARLQSLRDQIVNRCRHARLVAVEGYSMGTARQPSRAHALGELGGVIRLALWEEGVDYIDVSPASLKKYATGHGNAAKDEVLASAIRRLGYEGHDHNQADALWLRAMALDALGTPAVAVPASHRDALGAITWPHGEVA